MSICTFFGFPKIQTSRKIPQKGDLHGHRNVQRCGGLAKLQAPLAEQVKMYALHKNNVFRYQAPLAKLQAPLQTINIIHKKMTSSINTTNNKTKKKTKKQKIKHE